MQKLLAKKYKIDFNIYLNSAPLTGNSMGADVFEDDFSNLNLYVPNGSVAAYK